MTTAKTCIRKFLAQHCPQALTTYEAGGKVDICGLLQMVYEKGKRDGGIEAREVLVPNPDYLGRDYRPLIRKTQ